jgi:hypothetical protein
MYLASRIIGGMMMTLKHFDNWGGGEQPASDLAITASNTKTIEGSGHAAIVYLDLPSLLYYLGS